MDERRSRRGPAPLASSEKRGHCVSVRLNAEELAWLDAARGHFQRGEFLRMAAVGKLPPAPAPELNREAWAVLARAAGNLATLGIAMRGGEYIEAEAIIREVAEFRAALLGAKLP